MTKVTIIGTGSVGSTIAYTLTVANIATEIIMIDINGDKAIGEAIDIRQGTPFTGSCHVYAGDYSDAVDSNIVIITSGVARKPGQTRLELAQVNVNILKSIIPNITKYAPDATYIIVSNPVDILTYTFCKCSGISEDRIIGSGTILDTSRLKTHISQHFSVSQQNVHAYVLGEHGDSSFIPWSLANISNVPIRCYHEAVTGKKHEPLSEERELEYVRKSGADVIGRKGATFYAVSASVCHICKCLLSGIDTPLTVSTMLHGEYGIDDVCLSLLNIVGRGKVSGKLILDLTDDEVRLLKASAESLKEIIKNTDI